MSIGLIEHQADLRDAASSAVYNNSAINAWRGYAIDKCPADLIAYQQIIHALKPEIIIETGTWYGGSALFFADMCELVDHGKVLSIDILARSPLPVHPRLTYLAGDSTGPIMGLRVLAWAEGKKGLVVLDSDHTKEHVITEMDEYHQFVAPWNYMIVEDTNINNHPVRADFGPGPWEAVDEWLPEHPSFRPDRWVEPYLTYAPGGYLRREQP